MIADAFVSEPTTVAVVDANETFRRAVGEWLAAAPGCQCVALCVTAKEALAKLPRIQPDVLLLDVYLAGESGITCAARLKQQLPGSQVIFYTVIKDLDHILQALRAGACGYLLKDTSGPELIRAILEARSGGAPLSGEVARQVVSIFQRPPAAAPDANPLSPREREVLEWLSQGLSNKQIALGLGISYETVCVHLRRIYAKLQVQTRTEAVIKHLRAQTGWHGLPAA